MNHPLEGINDLVNKFYPGLLDSVHVGLSVFGSMSLADRIRPVTVVLEGPSGFGKTAVLQMFMPILAEGEESEESRWTYRSDDFTAKVWAPHTQGLSEARLAQIDLLPRLDGRVFVTKDLAPLFNGREEEVRKSFSILISVLDGQGYVSNSGTQGQRGYKRRILFNWIGATTPLHHRIHSMMSQLGTRMLFYEVPSIQPSKDRLNEYLSGGEERMSEELCSNTMAGVLDDYFQGCPVASVNSGDIGMDREWLNQLSDWSRLLVRARAEVKREKASERQTWEVTAAGKPEGPYKVGLYLKYLGMGHALISGRKAVTAEDGKIVAGVAIGSIPGHIRPIIRHLMMQEAHSEYRAEIDTHLVRKLCHCSQPTANRYMQEVAILGIASLVKGGPRRPDTLTLHEDYRWVQGSSWV